MFFVFFIFHFSHFLFIIHVRGNPSLRRRTLMIGKPENLRRERRAGALPKQEEKGVGAPRKTVQLETKNEGGRVCVITTPQMTRFRDAKVRNNWLQKRIDDHRTQSDYKYKSELQNPEGTEICTWYYVCVVTPSTTPMTT